MAQPITWQNVNGPSLADAAAPMAAAQRSFDTAFSRVGDELVRRQATQDANYAQGKTNNTEAFLAQMSQYRTPEELQAAQQSGALNGMLQGFGAQVDQAAVRQAQDLRPGVLQERVQREGQFQDAQLEREQAPIRDAIQAAINRGDILTANILQSGAPGLRNTAGLEASKTKTARDAIIAGRLDTQYAQAQELVPLQKQKLEGDITAQAADSKIRQATAESLAADRVERQRVAAAELLTKKAAEAVKAKDAAIEKAAKGTVMEGGTLNDSAGQASLTKAMDEAEKAGTLTSSARRDILYNLNEYAPNGMYKGRPVPASVALQLLRESEENAAASLVPGWSRRGDNFANLLSDRMNNPELLGQIDGVLGLKRLAESGGASTAAPAKGADVAILEKALAQRFGNGSLPASMGGKPLPK